MKNQGKLKICKECGILEYHKGTKICRECVKKNII